MKGYFLKVSYDFKLVIYWWFKNKESWITCAVTL